MKNKEEFQKELEKLIGGNAFANDFQVSEEVAKLAKALLYSVIQCRWMLDDVIQKQENTCDIDIEDEYLSILYGNLLDIIRNK
jgi:hypothetical protein